MTVKSIYLAGPFFDTRQLERLRRVQATLAKNPTIGSIFVPMDESAEISEPEGSPAWRQKTYASDLNGINSADLMVALYDYQAGEPDSGTMFEIGYAAAHQMPVVVYHEGPENVNLMIAEALTYYTDTLKDLELLDFDDLPARPYTGKVI
ncbi:nucleoside 2-deoxyribosyltransferase [Lactobacillus selangorensis]